MLNLEVKLLLCVSFHINSIYKYLKEVIFAWFMEKKWEKGALKFTIYTI